MKIGYADPPYVGQAHKLYGTEEVDHAALIAQMHAEFGAWALSCSSPSLPLLLPRCPPGVRVGAWVKPFHSFKPNVNPSYGWEPVIFVPGRKRARSEPTVRDWVSCNITLKRGLCGVKPEKFCFWLFDLLGVLPEDEFVDLFPGTGAVTIALEKWRGRGVMPL